MNWLYNYLVVCLNLGRHELSFLFAKIIFGIDEKGQKPKPSQRAIGRVELISFVNGI